MLTLSTPFSDNTAFQTLDTISKLVHPTFCRPFQLQDVRHVHLTGNSNNHSDAEQCWVDPQSAKFNNLNFHTLEVVPRYRDSQLQVDENCS